MLRKRTRSHHKDQHMTNHLISDAMSDSDVLSQKQKTSSFLKMPGLFVGFNPRSPDADSVRSPTSPLDFRLFSGFGNPFRHHPRSENEPQQQTKWNHGKVGLSIIDSLDDETKESGKVIKKNIKKNILLERQLSVRSLDFGSHVNSLESPGNELVSDVLFEIGNNPFESSLENEEKQARSMDSGDYELYLKSRFGSSDLILENTENLRPLESGDVGHGINKLVDISGRKSCSISIGLVPVSEIEDSEDYTCVRTHGPNPKVTHIFGDRVLECRDDEVTGFLEKVEDNGNKTLEAGGPSNVLAPNSFLKFCDYCNKGLDGEDIYMYRGEKAFCSFACRSHEIEKEEETEKTDSDSSGISDSLLSAPEVASRSGLFIAT